ncbi:MAG: PhoH family protein [Candidatus Pacebacteria bacterium]|nr:PhoH family protein [Candidatus Paceibacterota bacterium]
MAERRHGRRNPSKRKPARAPTSKVHTSRNKPKSKKGEENSIPVKKSIPDSFRGIRKEWGGIISFVLDTNVIMTAWDSLFKFEEHDVYIVSQVLKELDKYKKGHSAEAMNSRKATRILDKLSKGKTPNQLAEGLPLIPPAELENGKPRNGKLFFNFSNPIFIKHDDVDLDSNEPDDRIISICLSLRLQGKRVVFISNDGNARIKARAYGIEAEEYLNEAATEIASSGEEDRRTGFHKVPDNIWDELDDIKIENMHGVSQYELSHSFFKRVTCNEFLLFSNGPKGKLLKLQVITKKNQSRIIAKTFYQSEQGVWGVTGRNVEQELALQLLMDDSIVCVSLAGLAGSGKTYLALAAALQQAYSDDTTYKRIIISRATVGSDEDIGFLPGDEEEKMSPWMGSMHDNLEALTEDESNDSSKSLSRQMTQAFLREKIKIKSLNFMKGRTFQNTFLIIDEAQDLTVKKLKMITTRIGVGSKIILLGNVAQIDDPYINEHTSGISVIIRAFADSKLAGHVTLQQGERSAFATEAEERL